MSRHSGRPTPAMPGRETSRRARNLASRGLTRDESAAPEAGLLPAADTGGVASPFPQAIVTGDPEHSRHRSEEHLVILPVEEFVRLCRAECTNG
jgi:hypothetical protein